MPTEGASRSRPYHQEVRRSRSLLPVGSICSSILLMLSNRPGRKCVDGRCVGGAVTDTYGHLRTEVVKTIAMSDTLRLLSRAASAGLIASLVGFASSFAIIIQGLSHAGADGAEIASALLACSIAMCLCSAGLSLFTRLPIAIVWSTPGAALLATSAIPAAGYPAVLGALIVTGLMIAGAGLFRPLGRLITAIPRPIANAMLAGILLQLCLAPFLALAKLPLLVLPIIVVWAIVGRLHKLSAVPAAVATAALMIAWSAPSGAFHHLAWAWPSLVIGTPVFTREALIGVAVPLFVVTMASQNIPGLAVLAGHGYAPKVGPIFASTGLASALIAPAGAIPVNLAAITAALCMTPDIDPRPERRYAAAIASGLGYLLFGLAVVPVIAFIRISPPELIEAVAGLALIGALGNAFHGMVAENEGRDAAIVTFLITASGMSFLGIGGAFWGLAGGLAIHGLRHLSLRQRCV
ncbi:MAG TPA: benzoate/H(+) symporter BenE family transporter [Stellaceae bacterium]|nr:benzoate/H(+) symporter BenE family transporter [Stellaceae bacterium]